MKLTGGCLCGEVRFDADPPDLPGGLCQCVICHQVNTAAFISTIGILPGNFRWTTGERHVTSYKSSTGGLRHFCSICGSYLGDERSSPARFVVRLTALDDDPTVNSAIALDH
jgi:ADP-ribosyl-[dinitrogen reductase] hydrolase